MPDAVTARLRGSILMSSKLLFVPFLLIAVPPAALAQSAPAELRNKSVVVSWSEDRSLREVGEPAFRDVRTPRSLSIYISSTGRPFSRNAVQPGGRIGSTDYVGVTGASQAGGTRQIRFVGRSLEMTTTMTSGGARQIVIAFNDNTTSCEARVITAKQVGAEIIRSRSLVTGRPIEIRSVSVSGTSCSIREGNVFGE
jgi:hypothetical protein